jgi:hypothetical protein
MKNQFIALATPTLMLILLVWLTDSIFQLPIWHRAKWVLLILFIGLNFFTDSINNFGLKYDRIKFLNYFFFNIFVRILFVLIILFTFIYLKFENIFLLTINIFIFYFYYLGFEIYRLLGNLRADSK